MRLLGEYGYSDYVLDKEQMMKLRASLMWLINIVRNNGELPDEVNGICSNFANINSKKPDGSVAMFGEDWRHCFDLVATLSVEWPGINPKASKTHQGRRCNYPVDCSNRPWYGENRVRRQMLMQFILERLNKEIDSCH